MQAACAATPATACKVAPPCPSPPGAAPTHTTHPLAPPVIVVGLCLLLPGKLRGRRELQIGAGWPSMVPGWQGLSLSGTELRKAGTRAGIGKVGIRGCQHLVYHGGGRRAVPIGTLYHYYRPPSRASRCDNWQKFWLTWRRASSSGTAPSRLLLASISRAI